MKALFLTIAFSLTALIATSAFADNAPSVSTCPNLTGEFVLTKPHFPNFEYRVRIEQTGCEKVSIFFDGSDRPFDSLPLAKPLLLQKSETYQMFQIDRWDGNALVTTFEIDYFNEKGEPVPWIMMPIRQYIDATGHLVVEGDFSFMNLWERRAPTPSLP